MKKILFAIILGIQITSIDAIGEDMRRRLWTYQDHTGHFLNYAEGQWTEVTPNAYFHFEEFDRTDNSVVLLDRSRNIYVKLTATQMFLRQGAGSFTLNRHGQWDRRSFLYGQTQDDGNVSVVAVMQRFGVWQIAYTRTGFGEIANMYLKEVSRSFDFIQLVHEPSGLTYYMYDNGNMFSRNPDGIESTVMVGATWVQKGPR